MDKEQAKRMAYRTIVQEGGEGQSDVEYTVRVSGDRVEIIQHCEEPFEDEHDQPVIESTCWVMNLDTFKRLLDAGKWCIECSEAFEKAHPVEQSDLVQTTTDDLGYFIL